jgi:putative ABC transport system permease protein
VTAHRDDDALWARLRRVFRLPASRSRLDAEVDEELRFHIEGRVEEIMATEGLPRAQAELEARRRFGDVAHYRREARDIDATTHQQRQRMEIRDAVAREAGRAFRALRQTPGFTLVTIVTLALGIGAATAIFTLLDAVVLRPLPYANADRLVALSSPVPKLKGQTVWGLGRHQIYYFREKARSVENVGVYLTYNVTLLGNKSEDRPERVRWVITSASLFDVLGFAPHRGRLLTAEDNRMQMSANVVLSHAFWQRRFGGDEAIVGTTINIEGFSRQIVGILPPGASLPDLNVDVWASAHVDSTVRQNNHSWSSIARLRPGYTAADAERELAPLTARMAEVYPDVYSPTFFTNTGFTTAVQPLRDAVVGDMVTRALWAIFGAVALVLLIAAANVANLFLVRIDARRRDVAISTALGAGRSHLAVQYLTESAMLSFAAAGVALVMAQLLLRMLLALAPSELPRLTEVGLGVPSIAFALGVAIVTTLVFGLLPLASAKPDIAILREAGRAVTTSRTRLRARRVLVATQMAFAVVLLASAALMLRTFQNLRAVRPGFAPNGVLVAGISLPSLPYLRDTVRTSRYFEELARRVEAMPGVEHAGVSDRLPLLMTDLCNGITLEGPTPESATGTCPPTARVSPGYFEAIGTRVEGRTPTWDAMNAGEGPVVVSKAFADHHWPNESAIGKGVRFRRGAWYRVVGVAEDVRGMGVTSPPVELVYFPILSIPGAPLWNPPTSPDLVVKVRDGDPMRLAPAIARVAAELDPQVAVSNVRTMDDVVARSIAKQSFTMVLLLVSATIAMLLSAVGIYGVISYIVAQRRGEIGVRVALGANVRQVTGMMLRQSLSVAAVGVLVGVGTAIATTRFLSALLYGVSPVDPVTLVVVPAVLLLVAAAASYAPARRASRVDPAIALRSN